jgi:hypothetical protein
MLYSCLRSVLIVTTLIIYTIIKFLHLSLNIIIVESLLTCVHEWTYVSLWRYNSLIRMRKWLCCIFASISVMILCLHFFVCQLNRLFINWIHIYLFVSVLYLIIITCFILFQAMMRWVNSSIRIIDLIIS